MAYTVHNFEQGDVLYAEQLNEMDAQIAANEESIENSVSFDMLAEDYSANKTYSIGDYVIHDNELYTCTYEITAPEGWNSTHWRIANLGDGIGDLSRHLSDVESALETLTIIDNVDLNSATILNGVVYTNGYWYSNVDGRYQSYCLDADYDFVRVTAQENVSTYIAFLKYDGEPVVVANQRAVLADGQTGPIAIDANTTTEFTVPDTATHIAFWKKCNNNDRAPKEVQQIKPIPKIEEMDAAILAADNSEQIVDNYDILSPTSEVVTRIVGYYNTYGEYNSNSAYSTIWFEADEDMYVFCAAYTGGQILNVFKSSTFNTANRVVTKTPPNMPNYKNPLFVKAGNYVAFSVQLSASSNAFCIYKSASYKKVIDEHISVQTKQISDFEDIIKGKRFDGTLVNGYWSSASATSINASEISAVGCPTVLIFDEDVIINIIGSYEFHGYVGNTNYRGSLLQSVRVPKNTELRLGIKKLPVNDNSVLSVEDAYNAIRFVTLTQWSEYMRLRDTFYDFGIFRSIGCVGDSYTAVRLGFSWVTIMQRKYGIPDVGNFGYGGQSAKSYIAEGKLNDVLSATAKDFYWLALGINDTTELIRDTNYLGSEADLTGSYAEYPATFWGSYGHIIEAIQEHAPNAHFVLFKPIAMRQGNAYDNVSRDYVSIRQAIDGIGEHYGIPVVDPLDDVFYRSADYSGHSDVYVGDTGGHPSVMIMSGICNANQRLFAKACRDNWAYFADIRYANDETEP